MSSAAILTLGKALAWVGIPLALACLELWRLGREPGGDTDSGDWFIAPEPGAEDTPQGDDSRLGPGARRP